MKVTLIFTLLLLTIFQTKDTPDLIGTRSINPAYFWNNDRNLKLLKSKSNVLVETIKNGYYGDIEYLTFVDKKITSIKYIKNGIKDSVTTIKNGNGYLTTKNDTLYIQDGKLNGESYFYSFYILNNPTIKSQRPIFAKDQERYVMNFKDNFLTSMLVFRKGVLIYESYFKKYDFVKASLAKGKNDSNFQDSLLKIYNQDGGLRTTTKYKNGQVIK